jgi:hypothetical protein
LVPHVAPPPSSRAVVSAGTIVAPTGERFA